MVHELSNLNEYNEKLLCSGTSSQKVCVGYEYSF